MPTVVLRPQAAADLVEIWAYIAEDSPDHADAFLARIDTEFRVLARKPKIGRPRPELSSALRSLPVGRYVIFYVPRTGGIEVVRVLNGSRDLESLFEEYVE
jgi:toxin ParE1/3/4